jgi:hypothetical protein
MRIEHGKNDHTPRWSIQRGGSEDHARQKFGLFFVNVISKHLFPIFEIYVKSAPILFFLKHFHIHKQFSYAR